MKLWQLALLMSATFIAPNLSERERRWLAAIWMGMTFVGVVETLWK